LKYDPGDIDDPTKVVDRVRQDRSRHMYEAAESSRKIGVWKVGELHLNDMLHLPEKKNSMVTLTPRAEFDQEVEGSKGDAFDEMLKDWERGAEVEEEVEGSKGEVLDEPPKERKQEAEVRQEGTDAKGDDFDELLKGLG
jgi:hypothetical protein